MIRQLFFLFVFTILNIPRVYAQDDVELFSYWEYHSDVQNSIYKHFAREAFRQLDERKELVNDLKTKEDWLGRQSEVKQKFSEIVGEFPQKTPLNPQVTGVLKRDGYRIEKIIYESRPGYYVTSALYIPQGVKKNAPTIFYTCGHSREGFRASTYQHIIINLVKKGFVVFTIDPMGQGERYEYWDENKKASIYPIPDHEHSYAGAQCIMAGYSTANNFIWDIVRGVDYLLTRKEVDVTRIGMTGRSGGGNTTAYLGALDDRILATAPECYITSYEHLYKSIGPQCAEQNLYEMIKDGLDHADFLVARAPKPTMVISTTRDFFSIQGTRDSYQEASRMYKALGAEGKLTMVEDDSIHKSTRNNREAMYAFFQRELQNPGSDEDLQVDVPAPEELIVTTTGQLVTTFPKSETVYSLNKIRVQKEQDKLKASRQNMTLHLKNLPEAVSKHTGIDMPKTFGEAVFSGRYNKPGYKLEKYLIPGSGDYMLPIALYQPINHSNNKVVLLADTQGMHHAANETAMVQELVEAGFAVLLFDLPGIGSMGPGYLKGDSYIGDVSYNQWFAGSLAGQYAVTLRAEDIMRISYFIRLRFAQDIQLSVLVDGPLAGEVLHAALFDLSLDNIVLMNSFLSFAELAATHNYNPAFVPFSVPGAIKHYDLPDLMAGLSPRNLLIVNPVSADGSPSDTSVVQECLEFPSKVFDLQRDGVLDLMENLDSMTTQKQVVKWLRSVPNMTKF